MRNAGLRKWESVRVILSTENIINIYIFQINIYFFKSNTLKDIPFKVNLLALYLNDNLNFGFRNFSWLISKLKIGHFQEKDNLNSTKLYM